MIERYSRIIGSFLATAALYMAYAVAVVPWIEPPPPAVTTVAWTEEDMRGLEENAKRQRDELAFWFNDDDWELNSPKIIETPQGKLLFDDYRPLENGLVELKPCSMVFLSADKSGDEELRKRRAMVLRAPDGALLRFDAPIDLKQAKISKLIGGELLGEVQIAGGQRLPGPEDDLHIATRDVMLSETDISTPHLLEFRIGGHRGRGRGVAIELDNVEVAGKRELRGIKLLTLHEQVFVHLENQGSGDLIPGSANDAADAKPADASFRKPPVPVEVRCSGPFTFDFVQNVAVFRKSVEVTRRPPQGEADQIYADMLKVFFIAKESAAAAAPTQVAAEALNGAAKFEVKNLQPSRLEILGEPATVRAPSNKLQARAQFIEHDLATRTVHSRDAEEAVVRQEEREIRTPELTFVPEPGGRYGTFVADGRGRFVGSSPEKPQDVLQARWQRRLHFRKHDGQYVLTAEGSAQIESTGKGSLTGAEIHLWFKEVSKTPAAQARAIFVDGGVQQAAAVEEKRSTELVADRMLAVGEVRIESPQVNGAVERLEAWFDYLDPGPGMRQAFYRGPAAAVVAVSAVGAEALQFPPGGTSPAVAAGNALVFPPTNNIAPFAPTAAASQPPANPLLTAVPLRDAGIVPAAPPPANPAAAAPPVPLMQPAPTNTGSTYHIEGELMRLLVEVSEKQTHVREATIERRVKLTETTAAASQDKPLLITGDTLHLTQPAPQASFVTVTGVPAYLEARGMTLSGGKLTLDRPNEQTNIVGVPGQGLMTLPVDRDLQGRPTGTTEPLTLTWQGQLAFDGLTARFQRGVEARLTNQYLRTDQLDVAFTQPVTFGKSTGGKPPDVHRLDCRDGVFLENRTLENRALKSVDRMTARTLALDRPTGDFTAEGPGEVVSVRVGSPMKPGGAQQGGPAGPAGVPAIPIGFGADAATQPAGERTINYLQTSFQRGMAGNEMRREMNFYNQVRVLHGPVPDWNTVIDRDRPETWRPQTVLIDCDQLQVTSVREGADSAETFNLVAAGNTLVESNTFTARARA
ncbi:MAG: hypothetical protein QM775_22685 [Pirellulales bacterium]